MPSWSPPGHHCRLPCRNRFPVGFRCSVALCGKCAVQRCTCAASLSNRHGTGARGGSGLARVRWAADTMVGCFKIGTIWCESCGVRRRQLRMHDARRQDGDWD
jgi:hypothetical protein